MGLSTEHSHPPPPHNIRKIKYKTSSEHKSNCTCTGDPTTQTQRIPSVNSPIIRPSTLHSSPTTFRSHQNFVSNNEILTLRAAQCDSFEKARIRFSRSGSQQLAWTPPGEAKVDYSSKVGTHWALLAHESSSVQTHRRQKDTSN